MKKVYKRIIITITIFAFLLSPLVIHSYEFEDESHNSRAHGIRQEIYDLYDAYKEIFSESNNQFGIIGYN